VGLHHAVGEFVQAKIAARLGAGLPWWELKAVAHFLIIDQAVAVASD